LLTPFKQPQNVIMWHIPNGLYFDLNNRIMLYNNISVRLITIQANGLYFDFSFMLFFFLFSVYHVTGLYKDEVNYMLQYRYRSDRSKFFILKYV
jgi:hypothetical protein